MHNNELKRASDKSVGVGQAVIRKEADALGQLSSALGMSFAKAVELIIGTTGRLVVTGVGKSGHIGRKAAATFSATGSPAFFVHAAEASHGDLGMIKESDTMIIFSNSGSTPELKAVISFAETQKVPIIGIASKAESLLIRRSTAPLILPDIPEACPQQMAPTTSTTMMLALGDALAIAAMEGRGVSSDHLRAFHPGGMIGHRNRPIEDVLDVDAPLPIVLETQAMRDVVFEMTTASKGVAGVVDTEGNLVGVISDGDLRRSFDRILIATAKDVMSRMPKTVASGTTIGEVRRLMQENQITAIFVMSEADPRRPKAVVNVHDLGLAA